MLNEVRLAQDHVYKTQLYAVFGYWFIFLPSSISLCIDIMLHVSLFLGMSVVTIWG